MKATMRNAVEDHIEMITSRKREAALASSHHREPPPVSTRTTARRASRSRLCQRIVNVTFLTPRLHDTTVATVSNGASGASNVVSLTKASPCVFNA